MKGGILFTVIFALIFWVNTFFVFNSPEWSLWDRLLYATIVGVSAWATITVFMFSFFWLYKGLKK